MVHKESSGATTLEPPKTKVTATKKPDDGNLIKNNGSKAVGSEAVGSKTVGIQKFQTAPTADMYPPLFFSQHPYFHQLFRREAPMFESGKVLSQSNREIS